MALRSPGRGPGAGALLHRAQPGSTAWGKGKKGGGWESQAGILPRLGAYACLSAQASQGPPQRAWQASVAQAVHTLE